MTLPQLEVRQDKIAAYLLDLTSKRGASKARFFLGRGFALDEGGSFASALAAHGFDNWPGTSIATPFGTKHVLVGPMFCPDNSSPNVLTVWMAGPGGVTASLVTAYPK